MDRIDMENITDRYAELRDERAGIVEAAEDEDSTPSDRVTAAETLIEWDADNAEELAELGDLIEELRGAGGGDHQWEGDWFPRELIAEADFEEYAQELAEDCGMVNESATWPNNCIDWERAARELTQDYSMVTYQGTDYYWR